jgi:hypothetical protein
MDIRALPGVQLSITAVGNNQKLGATLELTGQVLAQVIVYPFIPGRICEFIPGKISVI